jgi:hypothetical protein
VWRYDVGKVTCEFLEGCFDMVLGAVLSVFQDVRVSNARGILLACRISPTANMPRARIHRFRTDGIRLPAEISAEDCPNRASSAATGTNYFEEMESGWE